MSYDFISDPAFGTFLVIVLGLVLLKIAEKVRLKRAGRLRKNNPAYIISNGKTKRKVDI